MIRLFTRLKSSKSAPSLSNFDLDAFRNQFSNAQESFSNKLNLMNLNAVPNGKFLENVKVAISQRSVRLKELGEVSQRNNSNWIIYVTEEPWTDKVIKAIKTAHPHLSPSKKDSTTLIVPIPQASSTRKLELLKEMKDLIESSKQVVRNIRADARTQLKKAKLTKDETERHQLKIQKMVDDSLGKLDTLYGNRKKKLEMGK